jgi:hypothetical protein
VLISGKAGIGKPRLRGATISKQKLTVSVDNYISSINTIWRNGKMKFKSGALEEAWETWSSTI